jgi:hypothetical protein
MVLMADTIVFVLWAAMAVPSVVLILTAVVTAVQEVRRGKDEGIDGPSPVSRRSAPFVLLAAAAVALVRYLRDEPLGFSDIVFTGAFIGLALSAGWYLAARRSPALAAGRRLAAVSAVVAVCFGILSGFAPTE